MNKMLICVRKLYAQIKSSFECKKVVSGIFGVIKFSLGIKIQIIHSLSFDSGMKL